MNPKFCQPFIHVRIFSRDGWLSYKWHLALSEEAAERLSTSYLMAEGRQEESSHWDGAREGGREGVETCPRCGRTSSFVCRAQGVIGTERANTGSCARRQPKRRFPPPQLPVWMAAATDRTWLTLSSSATRPATGFLSLLPASCLAACHGPRRAHPLSFPSRAGAGTHLCPLYRQRGVTVLVCRLTMTGRMTLSPPSPPSSFSNQP